jgi:ABC-type sugar transport system ATPase subunit
MENIQNMSNIILKNVSKKYDKAEFINNFALNIDSEKITVLLGPTGCGKSTILKIIAGLIDLDGGDIYMDNLRINNFTPAQRGIGMIFQQNTLFPHMKVRNNIEFGLIAQKWKRDRIEERISYLSGLLNIQNLLDRYPSELSGGEQQKVAIARALAPMPRVLLLDEPLSSLDARIKMEILDDLKMLQKSLKLTYVYVTHDHEEAFMIGDKIVIMENGTKMQEGDAESIYNAPANGFVAWFVGYNKINIKGNEIYVKPEQITLEDGEYEAVLDSVFVGKANWRLILNYDGQKITVVTDPETGKKFSDRSSEPVKFKINSYISYKKIY